MNPVLIDVGFFQIYWYSFLILVAFVIGGYLAIKEAKKFHISEDYMTNMFFFIIIFAIVGARLYYVLFNLDYYLKDPISILKVWEGGLAIHGGIIACIIVVITFTKKHNLNTLRIMDIMVVSLILGQAIGRWGNFINQEAFGPATTLKFLTDLHLPQFIIDGMHIGGKYYQPTFLYESIGCLIGLIVLLILRRRKSTKVGMVTSVYFIWYGILRFFIEALRQDSLMLGSLKIAQIVSIVLILIGIIMFIKIKKNSNDYYKDRMVF